MFGLRRKSRSQPEQWPQFASRFTYAVADPERQFNVARAFLFGAMNEADTIEYNEKWRVEWREEVVRLQIRLEKLEGTFNGKLK